MKAATVPMSDALGGGGKPARRGYDYLPGRMDAAPEKTFSYYLVHYIIIILKNQEKLPSLSLGRMDKFIAKELVKRNKS